jgi:uncharacterized membrane protein
MQLEIEGKVVRENPTREEIAAALTSLDGKKASFAVLSHSGMTYLQASGSVKDGFSLEYQNGSLKEHYCCLNDLPLEDVTSAFQAYAKGNSGWQTAFDWEPMNRPLRAIRVAKPRVNLSPSALVIYAFTFLCILAVIFASRKGANKRIWISVFFVSGALWIATWTTNALKTGAFGREFRTVTRTGSPTAFWLVVAQGYTIVLVILILVYLFFIGRIG